MIKKNDTVIVRVGDDKGKKGKVLKVFPREGKALVEGINTVKRHQKPQRNGSKGQVVEKPMPIQLANLKSESAK